MLLLLKSYLKSQIYIDNQYKKYDKLIKEDVKEFMAKAKIKS